MATPARTRALLIRQEAHQATANVTDPIDRLSREIGYLQNRIVQLCEELQPSRTADMDYCEVSTDAGDLLVGYEYSPGRPGRMYMPNGDPGYPDEPAELQIIEIWVGNGCLYWESLSESLQAEIERGVEQHIENERERQQADAEAGMEWE